MKDKIVDLRIGSLNIAKIRLPPPKELEEKRIVLIGTCPFCDRKVRGSTHSQLDWNLYLHVKQKHKNDPENGSDAEVLLKQLEEQRTNSD